MQVINSRRRNTGFSAGTEPCLAEGLQLIDGLSAFSMFGFQVSLQIDEDLRVNTRFKKTLLDLINRVCVSGAYDHHIVDDQ